MGSTDRSPRDPAGNRPGGRQWTVPRPLAVTVTSVMEAAVTAGLFACIVSDVDCCSGEGPAQLAAKVSAAPYCSYCADAEHQHSQNSMEAIRKRIVASRQKFSKERSKNG